MADNNKLRIGTRGSPLALTQTGHVVEKLKELHPILRGKGMTEMVVIKTTGDRVQNQLLASIGGKGLFTKELDEAMLRDEIDIAIHSMKDMPTFIPEGILLHAIMKREDPRDAFISNKAASFKDLPQGATLGTASLRRKAQMLNQRPDLKVVPFRGNVDTRLRKLNDGEADATLLAYAGLKRLGKGDVATSAIEIEDLLPAVGQGILAATCREGDKRAHALLAPLGDAETVSAALAERAMLAVLDGSCQTPIGGFAQMNGTGNLVLRGNIARPDGAEIAEIKISGPVAEAEQLGKKAADQLLLKAAPSIIEAIKSDQSYIIRPHPEMESPENLTKNVNDNAEN